MEDTLREHLVLCVRVWLMSLNPYSNGRYSTRSMTITDDYNFGTVLILILMEYAHLRNVNVQERIAENVS